jgi:Fic family protein
VKELLVDAVYNFDKPLTKERLLGWHNALFSHEVKRMIDIRIAEITPWLEWFLETLLNSLKESRKSIQFLLQKTAFWDRHRMTSLNEREIKVLNRLFRVGEGNFEGGINTKKYASLTKVSKNTASRELKGLVEKGCLRQVEGTAGRNIRYELKI